MTKSGARVLFIIAFSLAVVAVIIPSLFTRRVHAQKSADQKPSSYTQVVEESFDMVRARDKAAKNRVMEAHQRLLEERYDLGRHVDEGSRMTRGKPIQVGLNV